MLITYFVHDLADPAIGRRVTMLRRGEGSVRLYGFRRTPKPVSTVGGVAVRNSDGRAMPGCYHVRAPLPFVVSPRPSGRVPWWGAKFWWRAI